MGVIITLVLVVLSYFIGRSVASSNPNIVDWSTNKKQALSIAWFAMCVLLITLAKVMILPDEAIENQIFGSIGISIIFGMIFYQGLKPKKQTA